MHKMAGKNRAVPKVMRITAGWPWQMDCNEGWFQQKGCAMALYYEGLSRVGLGWDLRSKISENMENLMAM